jgi:outer membrane immunogenic protein
MKKFLAAAAIVAATSVSANAADLNYKAAPMAQSVYNWTGFYLGANAGGGFANADHVDVDGFNTTGGINKFQEPFGTGGFTAGYNWQLGHAVLGIEGDYNFANVDVSQSANFDGVTTRFQMDQFATVRARAGIALDQALIYATAGVAFGHFHNTTTFSDDGLPVAQADESKWKTGLAVGAGVEYALTHNWSLKGEYMLMQFGNSLVQINDVPGGGSSCGNVSCRMNYSNSVQLARIGLNYKFGY